jgi:large subunit ribosomal protein L30
VAVAVRAVLVARVGPDAAVVAPVGRAVVVVLVAVALVAAVAGSVAAALAAGAPRRAPRRREDRPVAKLRIELVRSGIGHPEFQKLTVRSLGLRRMHQVVEHEDNPAIRGMVRTVAHLVKVEEVKE